MRQGWWSSKGIVTALSGGGDSVALLWLLKNFYKGKIVAAHLDHSTREGASCDDALFSQGICDKWGIKCCVKKVEVYQNRLKGESFEMAGRRERYTHFHDTAKREGLDFIALGHSADDLVETQLLNLFRGTGLAGLRGIPETRGNIVRPIIDFKREELREILRLAGVSWQEDKSNKDTIYKRNSVREELIPWIKKNLNPNFEKSMLGLARQLNIELDIKTQSVSLLLKKVSVDVPPSLAAWNAKLTKEFTESDIADMVRYQGELLHLPTISRDRTLNLVSLIKKGGFWRFQWARDIEVCYSDRGIGWLYRADIENALKNKQKITKDSLPWWAR